MLAALPDADYHRLEPHLEWVELPLGKVIGELSEPLTHVYFPTEGIVSTLASVADGTLVEIAIIGSEGIIGTSLLLEGLGAPGPLRRSVVEIAGHAYRVRADILMAEFERGGKVRHWLLRYTQALITQIAQIAVCSRHHDLQAQLCRWLLQRLDRLASSELYVTHKQIASLLGVRRESVTETASQLQEAGLIRYSRGHVVVLDRVGIEERACECLGVIQKEYARLLDV
ncbi:MAG: Crp/Fnr family transcriptional regulator [Pseudomonadota bacterium]